VILTRRRFVEGGGVLLAALAARPAVAGNAEPVEILMEGNDDGSHVWYDPVGIHIQPRQTVRWTNRDPGNSHTATAYHPAISNRPRRIPAGAEPWDSDYILPGESFSVTLTEEGVYDFYCVPHEHAGMVGRIVVGSPKSVDWMADAQADGDLEALPDVALKAFPSVEEIIRDGTVRRV